MAKKFSIHDWVYPDGDPIKAANERVLGSFCEVAVEVSAGPRRDINTVYSEGYLSEQVFLGQIGDADLWWFITTKFDPVSWIMWYEPATETNFNYFRCHLKEENICYEDDSLLVEGLKRAKAKGLVL